MKFIFACFALLLGINLQAQWHPFLDDLNVTSGERVVMEIGLICNLENPEFNQVYLGEKTVMIPALINGESLELDLNRFRVIVADTVYQNEQFGLILFLTYDRETKSTEDDLVVQQVFFPLSTKTLELVGIINGKGELRKLD